MSPDTIVQRAQVLYDMTRYEQALQLCLDALGMDPEHPGALELGGYCALMMDDSETAETMARSLMSRDPDTPAGHEILGRLAADRDDRLAAESHFRTLLRALPESPVAHAIMAGYLGKYGRLEEGITQARKGLALDSENPAVLQMLEQLYRLNDEPELAEEMGQRALAQDPDDADHHLALGMRLLERGRRREARAGFMESLRRAPAATDNIAAMAHERVRTHRFFRNGRFFPTEPALVAVALCVPVFWWLLSLWLAPLVWLAWAAVVVLVLGYGYVGLFYLCRWYVQRQIERGRA